MSEVLDFLRPRGEYVSLFVVAGLLVLAVRPTSELLALPRDRLGDLFWYGGLAFVVAGRVAFLAVEAPASLLDPLVLIRIQGGIAPLAGAIAALAVTSWRARRDLEASGRWLAAGAAGLAIAALGYDLACPLRDACFGAQAPPPLGFRMSGLADTRLATPLLEAAALLVVLAGTVRWLPRLAPGAAALGLLAALALLRAAFTPLSVRGLDAAGVETALLVAAGVALTVAAIVAQRRQTAAPEETAAALPAPRAAR
jgi:prolipoprotein diacylglyceryltransferase